MPSRPISVWDSEYGCAPFILKTSEIAADILVRLRSNLCLWGAPLAYEGSGRPRKHGAKFKLNEPSTWGEAASVLELNDPKLGRVKVSLWKNLHFRKAAYRSMSLLRVERLDEHGNLRVLKPLWLAWVGEEMPPLEEVWRFYLRRFTIDQRQSFFKATFTLDSTKIKYSRAMWALEWLNAVNDLGVMVRSWYRCW